MKLYRNFLFTSAIACLSYGPGQAKPLSSKSPASMYKVRSTVADSTFTYSDTTYETRIGDLVKTETKQKLESSLTALHKIPDLPMQIGFNFFREGDDLVSLTPSLAYSVTDHLSLGAEASSTRPLDSDKKETYQSAIGAIYHRNKVETGFGYKQDVGSTKDTAPKFLGAHIKSKFGDQLSAQLEIKDTISPESEKIKSHVLDSKIKVGYDLNDATTLKSAISYAQTAYKKPEYMNTRNISKSALALSFDYKIAQNFQISPEIELVQGYGSYQGREYNRKTLGSELAIVWIR